MTDLVGLFVALTIDLDGQPAFVAVEVENVGADGVLTTKPVAAQLSSTELDPEEPLRQGQLAAQASGSRNGEAGRFHAYNLSGK